jgi:hypothetical protein
VLFCCVVVVLVNCVDLLCCFAGVVLVVNCVVLIVNCVLLLVVMFLLLSVLFSC